jgi:hypothetical protein
MFRRILPVILAATLLGCGGAAASAPTRTAASSDTSAAATDEVTDLTLTTGSTTSPAELREGLARAPSRVPIAHQPAAEPAPTAIPPATGPEEAPTFQTNASGEPYAAPPSVSSDPVGEHLITTFFEVDSAGDVRLRYAR